VINQKPVSDATAEYADAWRVLGEPKGHF
jgi:hypothetical protein